MLQVLKIGIFNASNILRNVSVCPTLQTQKRRGATADEQFTEHLKV
jgi:hypothetical protein